MLNDYQKLTIRVAVGKAADKDAEIAKLAEGFRVPENEIRTYWNSLSGSTAAEAAPKQSAPASKPKTKPRGKRVFWTPEMISRLKDLRAQGETAARIAEMMGIDVKQVKNKLSRMPSVPGKPPAAPAVKQNPAPDPAPEALAGKGSHPEPAPIAEQRNQVRQAISKAFQSLPHIPQLDEAEDPEAEGFTIDFPEALLYLLKLVHEKYGDNVIRVHGDNDEHVASIAFEADGDCYELRLEVAE